jgi:acetoacetate decarboxylase
MFEFNPMGRYMMPAHFGMPVIEGVPSLRYRDVTAMTVVYVTDREKLAAHLPAPFEVGAEPLVTVTYARNRKVDFLAGRGYNMIRVNAAAVFKGEQDNLEGQFALVLWENLADPILTGREMAGIPKLFADIPDHDIVDADWRCSASHFGHSIVDMSISNPVAVTAGDIAAFQEAERGKDNPMGWRYLPRVGAGGAALSEPTIFPYEDHIDEAWVGTGSIDWKRLSWEQNPTQFHIVNALADLPVLEYRPALISRGSSNLFVPDRLSRVLR